MDIYKFTCISLSVFRYILETPINHQKIGGKCQENYILP